MLIRDTPLTPPLARWLRESHDDGEPELAVRQLRSTTPCGSRVVSLRLSIGIMVMRADGSEPSGTEYTEITARLAAHAVEPLK